MNINVKETERFVGGKSDEKCKMIVNSSSEHDVQNDSFKTSHATTQHAHFAQRQGQSAWGGAGRGGAERDRAGG